MAEQPSIDPRYDPAFQRGYDGPVSTGSRTDAGARAVGAPRVTSALRRADPESRRAASDDPVERTSLPAEPDPQPHAAASAEPAIVHVAAPVMRPPWTNPFAIVVAVLSIATLGVGLLLLQESLRLVTSNDGFETQLDYWTLQWGLWGGSILTGVGLAMVAAVLLFCAVYWSRRPQPQEE